MKTPYLLLFVFIVASCSPTEKKVEVDRSKHLGLEQLKTQDTYKVLYSPGHLAQAEKNALLVREAYGFLSEIMGPKKDFFLLVVAEEHWKKNAYLPIPGMPEYYKGNLIVGAGHNSMAEGYEEMIASFPKEITTKLYETYVD